MNQQLATLLAEQAARLAEYEEAQRGKLDAGIALRRAEMLRDATEDRARWRLRRQFADEPVKQTADALKDRLAASLWYDDEVSAARAEYDVARACDETMACRLSIARRRLFAVAREIEAIAVCD